MHSFTPRQVGNAKGERLAQRLSYILSLLHQGDLIDKHLLAHRFQVDVRTIERDLGGRLHGIAERNAEGQWQLTHAARSTIPARYLHDYANLVGTQHLFPDSSLRYLLQRLETPEPSRTTQVQQVPNEHLGGSENFATLQQAIEQRHPCSFTYKNKFRRIHPYRLIHKNGIWYLAAEEEGKLKNFSVGRVESLQMDRDRQFAPDPAHHAYINDKDDVWFTPETTEVLLRVTPAVAHYFTRRALLPQQHHYTDEDGSLLVTTRVNHMNQLLPVVRYWLPNVRIVRPLEWHEALVDGLRQTLTQWEHQH